MSLSRKARAVPEYAALGGGQEDVLKIEAVILTAHRN